MGGGIHKLYSKIQPIEYFRLFKKAWENVHQRDIIKGENSEFLTNIREIFSKLYREIKKYYLDFDIEESVFIDKAFQEYFFAEHSSHYIKKKTLNFLIKQKKRKAKIFIVSDFYCEAEVIKKWLELLKIDVDNLIDKIYVSCDYHKSKATGSLYKQILNDNKILPKQATMVGDNLLVDVKNARRVGLRAKWIAFPQIKRDNKQISKQKLIVPKQLQTIFEYEAKEFGYYTNYAFPLFAFTKRLFEMCYENKIKNLFFLAREGGFLKKLFDTYCDYYNYDINTHYFVVSRTSAIVTSAQPLQVTFAKIINKPFIRTKNFLKTLHFSDEEVEKLCNVLKINPNKINFKLKYSNIYKKIVDSKMFKEIYEKIHNEQRTNFTKYLNSFNVDIRNEGFFVVDSGWMGNMQRYIKNYFSYPQLVEGFYVGTANKYPVEEKTRGLLFNTNLKKLNWQNKIFSYRRLNYEEILRAGTPTCVGYDDLGQPQYAPKSKETEAYQTIIEPLQDKIFEKFIKIMEYDRKNHSNIYSVCAYMNYQMIRKSGKVDREKFSDMQDSFCDYFGYIGFQYVRVSRALRSLNFRVRDFFYVIKNHHLVNKKRKFWT